MQGKFLLHPNLSPTTVVLDENDHSLTITVENRKSASSSPNCAPDRQRVVIVQPADIIGSNCITLARPEENPLVVNAAYFYLSAYVPRDRTNSKLGRRLERFIFAVNSEGSSNENWLLSNRWRQAVNTCSLLNRPNCLLAGDLPRRKYLVCVNPFGGTGRAMEYFRKGFLPLLRDASIQHELLETEYSGHATSFLANATTLDSWLAIVVIGGDGLIYEVVNGLMQWTYGQQVSADLASSTDADRRQRNLQLRLPIALGAIPAGSGNGLHASVVAASGEPINEQLVQTASYLLTSPDRLPIDMLHVELSNNQNVFSILGAAWGLLADVDIESERYRSLGSTRFAIQTLKRLAKLRKYSGQIAYLPVTEPKPDRLPKLHEPLPDNWTTIKDEFTTVGLFLAPYISHDIFFHPSAQINDGMLHLSIIRARRTTRKRLLSMFFKMEAGQHELFEEFEQYRCWAFRLTPDAETNSRRGHPEILTVDGEVVHFGPVQGVVMAGAGQLLGRRV